jgi:hypothetical protein
MKKTTLMMAFLLLVHWEVQKIIAVELTWRNAVSGQWSKSEMWSPEGVPDSPDKSAAVPDAPTAPFHIDVDMSPMIGSLNIYSSAAEVKVLASRTLGISGDTTNNGLISINSNGEYAFTSIIFYSNPTLSGSGSVCLMSSDDDNPENARLDTAPGSMLTQALGHALSGHGGIYAALLNHGDIRANTAGKTLHLLGYPKINDGLMTAENGGSLNIAVSVDNTEGTILNRGGNLIINNGAVITGGTLSSTDSSSIVANGNARLSGLALSGRYYIRENTTTTVTGGLINDGAIWLNPNQAYSLTSLTFQGNQTLSGSGVVVLQAPDNDPDSSRISVASGATLTQDAGHTIRGHGGIYGSIDNLGTIEAEWGSTLRVFGGINQVADGKLTGGVWIARAGSTLSLASAGNLTVNRGTIVLDGPGSAFPNIDGLNVNDAQGEMKVLGRRNFTTVGDFENSGRLTVGGGSFTVNGDLNGSLGMIEVLDGGTLTAVSITQSILSIGTPLASSSPFASPVPEPNAWLLLLAAAVGMVVRRQNYGPLHG